MPQAQLRRPGDGVDADAPAAQVAVGQVRVRQPTQAVVAALVEPVERVLQGEGHRFLDQGQRVEFTVRQGAKGLRAADVAILA